MTDQPDIKAEGLVTLVREPDTWDGLKRYAVVVSGETLGYVEQYRPTFERAPRGSRIVSRRWKSKHPRWVYEYANPKVVRNMFRQWCETRKQAVAAILESRE